MSVHPDRIAAIGRALENDTVSISILTREHFDELMCYPQAQADHVMSPLVPGPYNAPQIHPREWISNNIVHPVADTPWAVPLATGAPDFYSVWNRAQQMNGLLGTRIYERTYNGRSYVIIKGDRAQRTLLRGTRYRADNAQIIEMGIGGKGLASEMIKGLKVAFFVGVGLEVLQWVFDDEPTVADLLGSIVVEVTKGALALGIAAFIAGLVAAPLGTFAFAPLAMFVVVGALAGWGLNVLDEHFDIKAKVRAGLAGALDWLEHNAGVVGEWTSAQYEGLRRSINDAVEGYRQSLGEHISRADQNFETVLERTRENPYLANPHEIQAAAVHSSGLRFLRWAMGD